jgi:hypothetical protein
MTLLEVVQEGISKWLEGPDSQKKSLSSLSRKSGVSDSTLRRWLDSDSTATLTLENFLMIGQTIFDFPRLCSLLTEFYPESSGSFFERLNGNRLPTDELISVFYDSLNYKIYCSCVAVPVCRAFVAERWGQLGLHSLDFLCDSGFLLRTPDFYQPSESNIYIYNHSLNKLNMKALIDEYDHRNEALGSRCSYGVNGYNQQGLAAMQALCADFIKKRNEIEANRAFDGDILCLDVLMFDQIRK